MSTRISARGVRDFHYHDNYVVEGAAFDSVTVLRNLQSIELSRVGTGIAAAEQVTPSVDNMSVVNAYGRSLVLNELSAAVNELAICQGASNGSISVAATQSGILWNTDRIATYHHFLPGDSPGYEFVGIIGPILSDTNMNNWGVLLALTRVLIAYRERISQSATPFITIQLVKN